MAKGDALRQGGREGAWWWWTPSYKELPEQLKAPRPINAFSREFIGLAIGNTNGLKTTPSTEAIQIVLKLSEYLYLYLYLLFAFVLFAFLQLLETFDTSGGLSQLSMFCLGSGC